MSASRRVMPRIPEALAVLGTPDNGRKLRTSDHPLLEFPLNDHGNALRIKHLMGDRILYSYPERCWYVNDDRRWARDCNGAAVRIAKQSALNFLSAAVRANDATLEAFAKRSLDQNRITSALVSLQCELPANIDEFDCHPYLLNFENGTVDLITGTIRPHSKTDKLTRLIHHKYDPQVEPQLFLAFLEQLMGGGPEASENQRQKAAQMIRYLQKAIGYSLTADTSEKVVFILHGTGNNGKSTLLDILRQLIAEYSSKILIDSLMVKPGGESPNTLTDLADLRGARFVNTSETEYGQKLSEGRLKRITQGIGTIKAVRKYENPITFPETHKLWIDANHLPVISGSENAIWNRLHAIPFLVVIPPDRIDRQMPTKLLGEAVGILTWCVEGARLWYAEGLSKPATVQEAVDVWREDMDKLGPFVEEMCDLCAGDAHAWIKQSDLWKAYLDWAERSEGKRSLDKDAFNSQLERHGTTRGKAEGGRVRVWRGIRFKRANQGTRDN